MIMTKTETVAIAILVAVVSFAVLSISNQPKEKQLCKEICNLERSEVRVSEPGICICK